MASVAVLVGCGAAQDQSGPNEVEVTMGDLQLIGPTNDPASSTSSPTVCTVGGITMHCCPGFQTGSAHYVMVGLNLAQNKFRCARLPFNPTNTQPITLAPASTTRLQDGVTFSPACPGGAMVGLHWDLRRVACAAVNTGQALFTHVDFTPPDASGMKHCRPVSNSPSYEGAAMVGIANNNPNVFMCLL